MPPFFAFAGIGLHGTRLVQSLLERFSAANLRKRSNESILLKRRGDTELGFESSGTGLSIRFSVEFDIASSLQYIELHWKVSRFQVASKASSLPGLKVFISLGRAITRCSIKSQV